MRKSLTFPCALVVCALMQTLTLAQVPTQAALAAGTTPLPAVAPLAAALSETPALSALKAGEGIAEARRLLRARTTPTQLEPRASTVTLAALDADGSELHLLRVPKDLFLVKGTDLLTTTELGRGVRLRVVRANGVNTAVTVTDLKTGRALFPLLVEYPIEKNGALSETAYYTSAHPALLSAEIVSEGRTYVRSMLDVAAKRLAEKGTRIAPDIVDVAEHLCIVEHTDHKRFLNEDRAALFQEILSLYALNQPDTYRYSVSTAGAGGMIQMIPSTYEMIRQRHPETGLEPDFVTGMRNHANALEAMLLYIQDTWNDMQGNADVQDALSAGIASKTELLAAGYNSNPARLPLYLRRGGALWRTLIPAETQMYLAIYSSLDRTIEFNARSAQELAANGSAPPARLGAAVGSRTTTASTHLIPWLGKQLLVGGSLLSYFLR